MPLRALFYIEQNYAFAILRPLQAEILRRGGEVRWLVVGDGVDRDYLLADELQLDTVSAVQGWNPDVVFVPGNYVSKTIPGLKVEVFHGFDSGKTNRKGRSYHFEIRHCFDLYCTHGKSTTQQFLELQRQYGTFETVETGWPAADPLFTDDISNSYSDKKDTRKTVLFCSTHSPRFSCAETIYERVKELIATGEYRWLIQFHPMMADATVNKYKSLTADNVSFVETDDVVPLLRAADVMLCDTSAILLMFLVQQKPVVTFRNNDRGKHLINVTEVDSLQAALSTAMERPPQLMKDIALYCQQMHPYRDGASSGRVVDAVEAMIASRTVEKLKPKPLNLLREFKERKKLNYWGLG